MMEVAFTREKREQKCWQWHYIIAVAIATTDDNGHDGGGYNYGAKLSTNW